MRENDGACPICGGSDSRETLTGTDRNQRLGGTFRMYDNLFDIVWISEKRYLHPRGGYINEIA